MPKIIDVLSNRRNLMIVLFAAFLFLRLFVSSDSVLLSADHLKFMEAAKNFPSHSLYNNELYLLHPPLYPYAIYFFTIIFQDDYFAAVFISIISAVITFFILYHLFMMLTKTFTLTFFVLVFFTLSDSFILASRVALRESLLVMLIFSSLYFYIKGVKSDDRKSILFASVIGSILAITSDHVIFLIPALALSYVFFNRQKVDIVRLKFPNLGYIILPLLLISMLYGSWIFIKFYQYSNSEYYVNGYEGMPIITQDIGLMQVISPQNFDDYSGTSITPGILSNVKRILFNFGYMFNLQPFSVPQGLNFSTMEYLLFPKHIAYMLVIYFPLALIALYGFIYILKELIHTKQIYNNANLYMLGLFFIFVFPVTQKFASPRYILTAYILLFYLISFGFFILLEQRWKISLRSKIIPVVSILLLLLVPIYAYSNSNLVIFNKKIIGGQDTADFVNANIPEDAGIMAQPGYVVKLIYLTSNRVLGLHHDPERLPYLVNLYDVDYIVTGRFYTEVRGLSKNSVEYVSNNPDKFELIATINENYTEFYTEEDLASKDELYVYKIKRDNLQ
jgi:hypothetical protein